MPGLKHFTAALLTVVAGALGGAAQAQWLHSVELHYVNDIPHVRFGGIWPHYDQHIAATATFDGATVWVRVTGSPGGFSTPITWELNVPLPPTGGGPVPIEVFYQQNRLGGLKPLVSDSRPVETVFWNGFER